MPTQPADLLIKGGTLVTHGSVLKADISILGEKILVVGPPGSLGVEASEVFDATGMHVLPGLIDPHVHMAHPYRGELAMEDAYHASVSAAFGGTTTILDFAIQWDKDLNLPEVVDWRRGQLDGEVVVDYGLHAVPTKSEEVTLLEAPGLLENGIPSFKVYMVYRKQGRMVDDAILFGLLSKFSEFGGTLMVHAENNSMAEFNQEVCLRSGKPSPIDFPLVKPNIVEAEAVNRVLYLSHITGGCLYIVHLSTREGLALVKDAIIRGDNVIAETCPHYLCLSSDCFTRQDGGRFICSPPLRSQEDSEALWEGLATGLISTIGSDHCGFGIDQKDQGHGDFTKTPHGLPGIEVRMPLIYTEGVRRGRITLSRMVELLSTNPARIFGLYPQKGVVEPGSDADLVVVDFEKSFQIEADSLHGGVDWSPYEGKEVFGQVLATILRGRFVVRSGELMVSKGSGQYLHRQKQPMGGVHHGA